VDLVDEEIPSMEDTTFMLTPAASTTASGRTGVDETLVVFCVDTSGSMCVTTEVPGKVKLRGSERLSKLQSLNDTRESQWIPGQKHNVTYVSRLQAVQAAVDHQLGEMAKDFPKRKVALVTFNQEVTLVGDGTEWSVGLSGDKLGDKEVIIRAGKENQELKPISDTRKKLGEKVFELEERGSTALGPALLASVAMACETPGSKVIICTDGLANIGLGSLEDSDVDDQLLERAQIFYKEVSDMAVSKGVSVSVVSIKGSNCKLVELGKVADATGGQVNIVDPLKLTQEFGTILADPIIATNVTARLLLHKGLYFREEESKSSQVERYVGNVTKESEITFEYGIRSAKKRKTEKIPEEEVDAQPGPGPSSREEDPAGEYVTLAAGGTDLPFQLQLHYTDLEGAKALRIITQTKPVTKQRAVAEKSLNPTIMGVHTAQSTARLAEEGNYSESRMNALMQQRLVSRTSKGVDGNRSAYKQWCANIKPVENTVCNIQKSEVSSRGRRWSDDEEEDSDMVFSAAGGKKKLKYKGRRKMCTDDLANVIYSNKSACAKDFK
jgi:hypothetical protein